MASRPEIKVRKKSAPDDDTQEAPNQKAKKETGNYGFRSTGRPRRST